MGILGSLARKIVLVFKGWPGKDNYVKIPSCKDVCLTQSPVCEKRWNFLPFQTLPHIGSFSSLNFVDFRYVHLNRVLIKEIFDEKNQPKFCLFLHHSSSESGTNQSMID